MPFFLFTIFIIVWREKLVNFGFKPSLRLFEPMEFVAFLFRPLPSERGRAPPHPIAENHLPPPKQQVVQLVNDVHTRQNNIIVWFDSCNCYSYCRRFRSGFLYFKVFFCSSKIIIIRFCGSFD